MIFRNLNKIIYFNCPFPDNRRTLADSYFYFCPVRSAGAARQFSTGAGSHQSIGMMQVTATKPNAYSYD
ncbi:hypothetical protein C7T94_13385 [Pedobacter yulinensis]|uniref:Uncharacterized protein n=1 Tax=Pedobacter yulinensis TaxID=2126353 RepID=A0A2T3HM78_9SPHI|nr:hypothetical protein C7T94_13385 [Pedobacter yulinensis]